MRWQRKTDWQSADGTVTDVEVVQGRGGPIYTVSFNYKVGEHWYGGFFTNSSEYKKDDSISVRYDPADPDRNEYTVAASRAHLWTVLVVVIFAGLLIWKAVSTASR
ncbi:Protein of unknown function [Bryocella elongata]|uniref:DUF3592 domain-containing protein n=1 Tax=Bryocella elongata TaxID=863522 RepID=A0A1H6C9F3_9BACT|nr:DUF3592 domain-containing protein [Bryocella elongata]SEG69538.1 Protein of unknown function [Bryocella elongata]